MYAYRYAHVHTILMSYTPTHACNTSCNWRSGQEYITATVAADLNFGIHNIQCLIIIVRLLC